jgi:hypothetical protein
MNDQMGHEDGSLQARYAQITVALRRQLLDALTRLCLAALDVRRAMSPRSRVPMLDQLLRERAREGGVTAGQGSDAAGRDRSS